MTYCTEGSEATVSYSFNGVAKKFVTKKTPIGIITKSSENLSRRFEKVFPGEQTGVTFNFTCEAPIPVPSETQVYFLGGTFDDIGKIGSYSSPANQPTFTYSGAPVLVGKGQTIAGSITNTIPSLCGFFGTLEWRIKICTIEIVSSDGKRFKDDGECPIKFTVTCGDECPEGQIKCKSDRPPGYCCIPCSEVEGELQAIRNSIKRYG